MAERPVFLPSPAVGLVKERSIKFDWFPWFSVAQKQRSISALHEAAGAALDSSPFLEVSTKSPDRLGVRLSAFNLELDTEVGRISIESAFQGSKVFSESGQHPELYQLRSGREVRKLVAAFAHEPLIGFHFAGQDWPLRPRTAFYDWLYLNGLTSADVDVDDLSAELGGFAGFTDIEFNPAKSINCQARSCALFVALSELRLIGEAMGSPASFREVLRSRHYEGQPTQDRLF